MKETTIDELAAEVEKEQGGKKVSQVKRDFAVLKVMSPGKSNTQIAREVGTYAQPAKMGHQLARDPSVNALQEKLEAVMDFPIDENNLTTDMITKGLAKEAIEADNSRDRREAFHLLGKSKGMFKEIIEHRDLRADEEFLQDMKDQLGPEAARVAAEELGLDWDG